MLDFNHDGNEDYWDDVFYYEQIERDSHSLDDPHTGDWDDDDEDDEFGGGYSYSSGSRSSSTRSYSNTYRKAPTYQSAGVPFIVRLIIASVVVSILGAFSELLGFIALIIWVIIECNTR